MQVNYYIKSLSLCVCFILVFFSLTDFSIVNAEDSQSALGKYANAIDAIFTKLDKFELAYRTARSSPENKDVLSTDYVLRVYKPRFSITVTAYFNGKQVNATRYCYDGSRYYRIDNKYLLLSSALTPEYLTETLASPLAVPWLHFFVNKPERFIQVVGTDVPSAKMLSGLQVSITDDGILTTKETDGCTKYSFSNSNFEFPQWSREKNNGGKTIMQVVAIGKAPDFDKALNVPTQIKVDGMNTKNIVTNSTLTTLRYLKHISDSDNEAFSIAPDHANIIFDNDLNVFLKSEQ